MKSKTYLATVLTFVLGLMLVVTMPLQGHAQQHEKVVLEIRSSSFGSGAYRTGIAWAEIINKSGHPWLTATCQSALGGSDNIMRVTEKIPAEKRKKTIFSAGASSYYLAKNGAPPFKRSYKGEMKGVIITGGVTVGFITLDPNINKPEDLIGKKIAFGPRKHTSSIWAGKLLNQVWNLKGKVKYEYMTFPGSADALRDGLVDVCMMHMEIADPIPIPREAWKELAENKADEFHFISVSKESVEKLSEIVGYPMGYVQIPAQAFGKGQTKPAGTVNGFSGCWWAAPDADEEVIYEAVKTASENIDKFKDYLGPMGAFNVKQLGELPITAAEMSPGAAKYYREKGRKVGLW